MPMMIYFQVHGSDLVSAYGYDNYTDLQDYIINFVNKLNPNSNTLPLWPQYAQSAPLLQTFQGDASKPIITTVDNYRQAGMALLTNLSIAFPL